MNNEDKIREYLEAEDVPEELSPENIKVMLDEKAASGKRRNISVFGRVAAAAAALAIVVGGYVSITGPLSRKSNDMKMLDAVQPAGESVSENVTAESVSDEEEKIVVSASYMKGASSYDEVYQLIKTAAENVKGIQSIYGATNGFDMDIAEIAPADEEMNKGPDMSSEAPQESDNGEHDKDFSDTYNQESDVLEADIVKTDGERIYGIFNIPNNITYDDFGNMVCDEYGNSYCHPVMRIASVEDGQFTGYYEVDVTRMAELDGNGWRHELSVKNMYLYNEMIAIISTDYSYRDSHSVYGDWEELGEKYFYEEKANTFVSFYTLDEQPELIGAYTQEGNFSDVRIAPDGFMYLITNDLGKNCNLIDDPEDIESYIPVCGIDDSVSCMLPEDILLPNDTLDSGRAMSYTIIGSIDMTVPAQFSMADTKALAGYSGSIYCAADNLYTTVGWEDTEITRFAIGGGSIVPSAGGKVSGSVLNQFSMSQYDGYFRIATTVNKWETKNGILDRIFSDSYGESTHIRHNCVYVLDMDLNIVGELTGFGKDESIKSVNFSGDMGYVVTYRQTDPLFAIDLRDPSEPVITDEFKINGFSTYMQKWDDGLLLGFGADADDDGRQTGIKAVMFDNSDPYELREVGFYAIHDDLSDDYSYTAWVGSDALNDRKALLIAPEKNLIGIPLTKSIFSGDSGSRTTGYIFLSYEDGELVQKGEFMYSWDDNELDYMGFESRRLRRAVYIGGYVYLISAERFVSADIDTLSETDSVIFS